MDHTILRSLFLDNPELPFAVSEFCRSIPEYNRLRAEYRRAADEITELVGIERYLAYEALLNRYWAIENRAYYLFGLQLRREVLESFRDRI